MDFVIKCSLHFHFSLVAALLKFPPEMHFLLFLILPLLFSYSFSLSDHLLLFYCLCFSLNFLLSRLFSYGHPLYFLFSSPPSYPLSHQNLFLFLCLSPPIIPPVLCRSPHKPLLTRFTTNIPLSSSPGVFNLDPLWTSSDCNAIN